MRIVKFGLKDIKTGKLYGIKLDHNNDRIQYILEPDTDIVWLVNSKDQAELVRKTKTEPANSTFETPAHSFNQEDLEAVKVFIGIWDENKS